MKNETSLTKKESEKLAIKCLELAQKEKKADLFEKEISRLWSYGKPEDLIWVLERMPPNEKLKQSLAEKIITKYVQLGILEMQEKAKSYLLEEKYLSMQKNFNQEESLDKRMYQFWDENKNYIISSVEGAVKRAYGDKFMTLDGNLNVTSFFNKQLQEQLKKNPDLEKFLPEKKQLDILSLSPSNISTYLPAYSSKSSSNTSLPSYSKIEKIAGEKLPPIDPKAATPMQRLQETDAEQKRTSHLKKV